MEKNLFFFIIGLFICELSLSQNHIYLNNPGVGVTTYDLVTTKKIIGSSSLELSTKFRYIYLSDVLKDNCITKNGEIDKGQLYLNIKEYFDATIDYTKNIRYNIRIFPEYNGAAPCANSRVLLNKKTDDGKLLINYPKSLHDIVTKQKYPPIIIKALFPKGFKQTKNIALLDFRNHFVRQVYRSVLKCFASYLKEKVPAPALLSSTNADTSITKGDFIARIEMGFIGPWGEGMTYYLKDQVNSFSLQSVAEAYKLYFKDYILISPSFGMRTNTTSNKGLYEFEYYLLTTKYGSSKKNKGILTGDREFGLFIDHIGSPDSYNDFSLNYNGQDFKTIALKKYLIVPVIGENSGNLEKENSRVIKDIQRFGLSLCNVWTQFNLNAFPDSTLQKWRDAASYFGYRFFFNNNHTSIRNNTLNVSFQMGNKSYSPLYDDFWLPQIVIRDNQNKELQVIDIDKELNLKAIPCLKSPVNYQVTVKAIKSLHHIPNKSKVYFRIIDKCHINENMFLDNDSRTEKGEYLLYPLK